MNDYWQLMRKDTNAAINLAQDMQWIDEFAWSKTAQSSPIRTLSGALDIQQGTRKAGRPITISGEWVWHKRGDLLMLRDWTDVPELEMTLTHYNGSTYNVIWRLHETALVATPVLYITPELYSHPYSVTINLMEF